MCVGFPTHPQKTTTQHGDFMGLHEVHCTEFAFNILPANPGRQRHMNPSNISTQVAPFWQGFDAQSSIKCWQRFPV